MSGLANHNHTSLNEPTKDDLCYRFIILLSNFHNCMQERNRYMVNASSLVIALFNGKNGGTQKTIEYAEKQGKEIVIIRPRETFDLTEQDIDDLANEFYEQTEKENYKMLLRVIYRVK